MTTEILQPIVIKLSYSDWEELRDNGVLYKYKDNESYLTIKVKEQE